VEGHGEVGRGIPAACRKEVIVLDALWTVEFLSDKRSYGTGVIIFDTDRVWGGDAQYYYIGRGRSDPGGIVRADIEVTHYAGQPSSIFGPLERFTVRLTGKVEAPVMYLQGSLVGSTGGEFLVKCTRREELPG
jgi:hypothetical protein